ncbi:hypothetical protein PPERSA_01579 [Pseudocohnilembus persalinus]|uniref:2-oxoglutarate dehydrogenase, mitochondrial n=1 Tax=Pseudocohnilembus persalinus TaxID=266149 RepID=A0A0V0QHH2_PSEPJ|nr:hypothetical protein PPERSA_01579 [Pseudocohnilembus persalinus]|eukprot:KRX01709.1 hypothetical protein PPERSA_01579 [Pseudocohnilembus persalinus]
MFKKLISIPKQFNHINKYSFKQNSVPKFSELKKFNESFLNPAQGVLIEQMFDQWAKDNSSVPVSWDAYFRNIARGVEGEDAFAHPANQEIKSEEAEVLKQEKLRKIIGDNLKIRLLIDNYRTRGHEVADLDPLNLNVDFAKIGGRVPDDQAHLNYKYYGFTEEDLEKEFYIYDHGEGFTSQNKRIKLSDLLDKMNKTYCDKVGYQYMHLQNHEERYWMRKQIELLEQDYLVSEQEQQTAANRLLRDYVFVNFLKNTFSTAKRFGSEGCDSFISGLEAMVDSCAKDGVEHVVIGMAHRGRLNTLYNVLKKPATQILAEFQGTGVTYQSDIDDAGDVKYHLGATHEKSFPQYDDKKVRISILPNPSHLETVDPLVYGKARATIDEIGDKNMEKVVGILIHGDAALAGQGVVYESLQFQDLDAYKVGGIVHVVVNNQIGFTTVPQQNRTSLYCTDVAETVQAPIFHVNAEYPEEVDRVMKLALAFRQKFKKDVFVDVIGYRKHGHNELDQPMFTQPLMYDIINKKKPIYEIYRDRIIENGIWTKAEEEKQMKLHTDFLKQAYEESRKPGFKTQQVEQKEWEKLKKSDNVTGLTQEVIQKINEKVNILPPEEKFNVNKQIAKIYQERYESIKEGKVIDYGTAEALAYGSLLLEGYGVRVTGQDVERGTFSHRHSKLNDQKEDRPKYFPLSNLLTETQKEKNALQIANSHLSEYGVCGFEFGYGMANPNNFVMWEAQFGDFANGAQIIFDNYMTSCEAKWGLQSQLVINLPHGMDGQGSEHSSGRIERFVQQSSDDPRKFKLEGNEEMKQIYESANIQVIVPSTPANFFHALRRQMKRNFRKPLISFTSKKLLKFRQAYSPLKDILSDTTFLPVIHERYQNELVSKADTKKVILCSGQVFYDLLNERKEREVKDIHILRLEELCPFPYDKLYQELKEYSNADFLWVQEEHWNQGGNAYVRPRYKRVLKKLELQGKVKSREIQIIARPPSASSATGSPKQHNMELQQLLEKVFA